MPSTVEIPASIPNRAEGKEEAEKEGQVETSGGRVGWRQRIIEGEARMPALPLSWPL